MDRYNYVTATIEDEKIRLEGIINYLKGNNNEEYYKYQERYNLISKYLNAKERYNSIKKSILEYEKKLDDLNKTKYEYEIDNLLLEDTLLNSFHEDTNNIYRNILYENINNEKEDIKDILYLMFNKETGYTELIIKRNRLRDKLDSKKYPKTIDMMNKQSIEIEKEDSLQDEMLLLENNIKIEKDKLTSVINSVLDIDVLKLLYEFCIINTYDIKRVDKRMLFNDNKSLINVKNILDI